MIPGGESQVFERRDVSEDTVFICSDTPPGIYDINGAVLDGRGGKLPFELTVEVTQEQVAGGAVEWRNQSAVDACGNNFCVVNDSNDPDNSRSYYYVLADEFSDYVFDQTDYVLSGARESGNTEFEFEIEVDGQAHVITLGPEAFDQINQADYDLLASAFSNAGQTPVRMRRTSASESWVQFRFTGPAGETLYMVLADFDAQDVSIMLQQNATVLVNRPSPGTGLRGGFNRPDTNCASFSYDPMTDLVESTLGGSTATNLRADMYVGGGLLLAEMVFCETTPAGFSEHQFSIIDGRGGKTSISLNVFVLDELVDGGRVQWAEEFLFPPLLDQDIDGINDDLDQFPTDPAASVDTDGDGMPDEWNLGCDVACQDASGLVLDDDDDGDGIPDDQDLFPNSSYTNDYLASDLTEVSMPFGLVGYAASFVGDPAIALAGNMPSWKLFSDGTYVMSGNSGGSTSRLHSGTWQEVGGGYVLTQTSTGPLNYPEVNESFRNINEDVAPVGTVIETEQRTEVRFAIIEQGDTTWRLAIQTITSEYATDPSIVLDKTQPVLVYNDGEYVDDQFKILSPSVAMVPFDEADLAGTTIAVSGLNEDDPSLTTHCSDPSDPSHARTF